MSIRMQRDINELKIRVEKLESVVVRLINSIESGRESIKRKLGRPKKNGTDISAQAND